MAFLQENFATVGAQSTDTPTIYSYKSVDSANTVASIAYFFDKRLQLDENDIILCTLLDGFFIMQVSSDTGTVFNAALANAASIVLTSEASFPDQDEDNIFINGTDVYFLKNAITTDKNFITTNGAPVMSSSSTLGPILTYTGTGNMFTITDANFNIHDIQVDHPNAQGYEFNDNAGGTYVFLSDRVRHLTGTKLATFNNPQTVLITVGAAFDMEDGISFNGTDILINSIDKLFMASTNASFKYIDLGSSISQTTEFKDMDGVAPAGAFGISGLANDGNVPVGRLAMVSGCEWAGGMTDLENIQNNDDRWDYQNNSPTKDTILAADAYLTGGTETITIGVQGQFEEIGIPGNVGVSWDSDISDGFTVGTNGVITYDRDRGVTIQATATATVEKVGGGTDQLEVRLAKNWVSPSTGIEKSRAITENSTPTSVPVNAIIPMVKGDNLRVIFANNDGLSDIDAVITSIDIIGG